MNTREHDGAVTEQAGCKKTPVKQMADLETYRATTLEQERTADLLRIMPKGRATVLDIGARDGHFSKLLTTRFELVTALDLTKPCFSLPRVVNVAGDVTKLDFPDNSFDCVFCAEVLEHIPAVERACNEISRVARHEIVIGVPFRQDIRVGRTTCLKCRGVNPPWGHVNSFDERRLRELFPHLRIVSTSFVGSSRECTNPVSAFLMDLAGNPWGTYDQDECCIHCGAALIPPAGRRSFASRVCSAIANCLKEVQVRRAEPHANWIHLVLSKDRP